MSLYTFFWMFLVYGFLGWLFETVFALITTKKLVNRGFLQGPIAVAYGLLSIAVYSAVYPFELISSWINIPISIPLTVVFSGVGVFLFEFVSVLLFKLIMGINLFDRKTVKSFIIKNSVYSVITALLMLFFQPVLMTFIDTYINQGILIFLTICLLVLLIDILFSFAETTNINKKITYAKELEELLNKANPDKSLKVYAKIDSLGEYKSEFQNKSAKYKRFIISNNFVYKRLAKAYQIPNYEQNLKLLEDLRYMYFLLKNK